MGRSPGFGSIESDLISRYSHLVSLRLRTFWYLTLPLPITRRTVLQKVRGCTRMVLPLLVNIEFQVLFHSPPGVLFTFPSQYYALSVTEEYLGLGGGPPGFPQGFSCLVVLWILLGFTWISLTGLSPSLMRLSRLFSYPHSCHDAVRNPRLQVIWFGLFPFRSPLLRKSMFLSPPEGT